MVITPISVVMVAPSRFSPQSDFEQQWDTYMANQIVLSSQINQVVSEINNFQIYHPDPIVAILTATQQSTATALTDITGLMAALEANAVYRVEAYVKFQSAAITTGLNLGFSAPVGATPFLEIEVPIVSSAANSALKINFPSAGSTNSGNVVGTGVTASGSNHTAVISGIVSTDVDAGSLQLKFASEVGGSAVTLQPGSILVVTRIG